MIRNLRVIYRDNIITYITDDYWECDGYGFETEKEAEEYVNSKYLDNHIW